MLFPTDWVCSASMMYFRRKHSQNHHAEDDDSQKAAKVIKLFRWGRSAESTKSLDKSKWYW